MTEHQQKPFAVETTVDAPQETVFRYLTEPGLIREWFGWDHDGIEAEIRYIFVDHATPEPPDRIAFDDGRHEIRLERRGDRTTIRVTMAGDLGDTDWDDVYDGIEEGWRAFFEQLRFLLERRPEGRRRTLFLSATAVPSTVVGEITGEVWHRSRYQRIAVDGAGHLLAFGAQRPLDTTDGAEVALTVTTYGLDDAAFAALDQEWTARWKTLTA